jgi:16S rRNA processing protein RimM
MGGRRPQTDPAGHVRVGQIVGVFGLKGAVKVLLLTDFPERFEVGSLLYLDGKPHGVLEVFWHKGQARVLLEGVTTPEDADVLKWKFLTVPLGERPERQEGEYMASDLVGLSVVEGGKVLGKVSAVEHSPAHDLLSFDGVLVPLVKQFVKSVDLERRVIEVELIEGMRPGEEGG